MAVGVTLHAITLVYVAEYRDQLVKDGKEPTTVNRYLSVILALFAQLVANGAMAYNPVSEVRSESVRRDEGKRPPSLPRRCAICSNASTLPGSSTFVIGRRKGIYLLLGYGDPGGLFYSKINDSAH